MPECALLTFRAKRQLYTNAVRPAACLLLTDGYRARSMLCRHPGARDRDARTTATLGLSVSASSSDSIR